MQYVLQAVPDRSVSQVNFFIGAFYDGVYLLGMALNETLSERGNLSDGVAITKRMWNRDFYGEMSSDKYSFRKSSLLTGEMIFTL